MTDRREEIIEVAKQMFAQQGVKSTTVRQIGASTGLLSGSLYHHFDSKLDMVDAILGRFCTEMIESYRKIAVSEGDASTRLRLLVRQGLALIAEDPAAVRMFQREAESLSSDERFSYLRAAEKEPERIWTGVIKEGIEAGEFRADIDVAVTYRIMRDVIASSARWHKPSGKSDDRIADTIIDVILNGIVVR